jgi:hypothetical protein
MVNSGVQAQASPNATTIRPVRSSTVVVFSVRARNDHLYLSTTMMKSHPVYGELSVHYEPELFTASEPTDRTSTHRPSIILDRLERSVSQSLTYLSDPQRAASPDGTSAGLGMKSPIPPSLCPVNVIQHEDAGPTLPTANTEPETDRNEFLVPGW